MSSNDLTAIARTRPYTYPEVLRAVVRALQQPHRVLPEPEVQPQHPIRKGHRVDAVLALHDEQLTGLLAWAQVLDPIVTIQLTRSTGPLTSVEVIGRIAGGPLVSLVGMVENLPLEMPMLSSQVITYAELVALGADATATAQVIDALDGNPMSSNDPGAAAPVRPYTYPKVLQAVARAIQQPHRVLPEPEVQPQHSVRKGHRVDAVLTLHDGQLTGLLAWARVLDPIVTIQVARSTGPLTSVEVIGRLAGGPLVSLVGMVADLPVEIPALSSRVIPYAELVALGADATAATRAVDALVGAP